MGMGIIEILRRIWLFSANKIRVLNLVVNNNSSSNQLIIAAHNCHKYVQSIWLVRKVFDHMFFVFFLIFWPKSNIFDFARETKTFRFLGRWWSQLSSKPHFLTLLFSIYVSLARKKCEIRGHKHVLFEAIHKHRRIIAGPTCPS